MAKGLLSVVSPASSRRVWSSMKRVWTHAQVIILQRYPHPMTVMAWVSPVLMCRLVVFESPQVNDLAMLQTELSRMEPREVLIPHDFDVSTLGTLTERMRPAITLDDRDRFKGGSSRVHLELLSCGEIENQVDAQTAIVNFGFARPELCIQAVCGICDYVTDTQGTLPIHARTLELYRTDDTLILDETAKQNPELFRTLMDGRKKGSLLGVLDRAATAMGGRRLKHWMSFPLISPERINARLDAVEWLSTHPTERARLRAILGQIYDLERLNGRAAAGNASPRDLWFMRLSLEAIPELIAELQSIEPLRPSLLGIGDTRKVFVTFLQNSLLTTRLPVLKDGGVIRSGFNEELDEWTTLASESQAFLLALETREREATGIGTLKVKFNRVFGYFIEVRRTQVSQVPEHYIRKQTLTNAERYITEELKAFEEKVVNAQSRRTLLESELFNTLRTQVGEYADQGVSDRESIGGSGCADHLWRDRASKRICETSGGCKGPN